MRHQLIEAIRDAGIQDLALLRVFDEVPRHVFVPEAVQHRAYEDAPLPIGCGQTTSQPSLQALYLQLLELRSTDRVLEVGTGSGFQTALLSRIAAHVYSIERVAQLAQRARAALDLLRIDNVALLVGDGSIGWARYAPYDAVLVAAGAPAVPAALLDQLAVGGRLLIPIGERDEQRLQLFRKTEAGVASEVVATCSFVPLIGRYGWPADRQR
ncbi:MAG: protein-L-isoaspartate(D-aspartate) O-methyltransferase [Gemmatimonadetes bacterium]|nr:protein-L-isoaspartate(D-aspartate) O-methyltransferase [Gemmatimonadota bacterium]